MTEALISALLALIAALVYIVHERLDMDRFNKQAQGGHQ